MRKISNKRGGSLLLVVLLAMILIAGTIFAVSYARYQSQRTAALAFEAKQITLPEITVGDWTTGDSGSPGWEPTETAFYSTVSVLNPSVSVLLSVSLCGSLGLEDPDNVTVLLYRAGSTQPYYGQAQAIESGSEEYESFGEGWRWQFYTTPTGSEQVTPTIAVGPTVSYTMKVVYKDGFTPAIPVMLRVYADTLVPLGH